MNNVPETYKTDFLKYRDLLLKWNKTYNLTAIIKPEDVWEKHFCDSLEPVLFLPRSGSLIDIGAGAGFPGIPIKIVSPQINVTLLEATGKKCNFCETVIRELRLKDIKVIHGRSDDNKIQNELGKFDIVISRATFSLNGMANNCFNYLKNENSLFIAMKGPDIKDEINSAKETLEKLQLKIIKIHEYKLANSNANHTLIIFRAQSRK